MRVILGAILASLLVPIFATAAFADNGDGQEGCHRYEICFSRYSSNHHMRRQFYYNDGDHSGNHWYDAWHSYYTSKSIEDDINRVRNRDGSWDVRVIDWNGAFPSVGDTIPNNGYWIQLRDGVRNQNNQHKRVNCR